MAMTRKILVRELKPALIAYLAKLEQERHKIFLEYWKEIRATYSKGWFVELFNPRLVEFFKKNPVPTREAVEFALTFVLPEHAWKLVYGTNALRGEIAIVDRYLENCYGSMDQENGRILVNIADLEAWDLKQEWSAVL